MYCRRCGTWTPDVAAACARCGEPHAPGVPVVEAAEAVAPRPPAPAAVGARAVRYGGFWRRFAAALVDGLVLFFPEEIGRIASGLPPTFTLHPAPSDDVSRVLTVAAATGVVTWLYGALLESSPWRGTLGQLLLGMRIGDTAGRRISFGRATGRYFAQYLSVLLCGLGYLFNLWTPRRQTLHDLVSGCVFTIPTPEPAVPAVIVPGQPS